MAGDFASSRARALLSLRAVAALAAKLADDTEGNRLWEGDFDQSMAEIQRHLQDAARSGMR